MYKQPMRHDLSHANDINGNDNIKQVTITINQKNTTLHILQAHNNVITQDGATNFMLFTLMPLITSFNGKNIGHQFDGSLFLTIFGSAVHVAHCWIVFFICINQENSQYILIQPVCGKCMYRLVICKSLLSITYSS